MQNGIDPQVGLWLNVVFVLLSAVAAGSIIFPTGMSPAIVNDIKTIATDGALIISIVNGVFHYYSSTNAGPGVVNK